MKKRILLVALTLCASSAVAADRFAEMDKDKNDKVTWEEFEAAMPQMRKPAFESIDTNKDNAITRAEWDTFRASHGAKGGMGGMGGKMPPAGMGMGTMPPAGMGGAPSEKAPMPLIQPPAKTPTTPTTPAITPPKQN